MKSLKVFVETLGLKYPIIQAPMAGVSTPMLASKVLTHGALGSLPFGPNLSNPNKVFDDIDSFSQLTHGSKTVNVNFFSHEPNNKLTLSQTNNWHQLYDGETKHIKLTNGGISFKEFEQTDKFDLFMAQLCQLKPKMVSFHFGIPSGSSIKCLQQHGILVFAAATSIKEVEHLVQQGVDGVVLQGYEAGGHRGDFLDSNCLDENLSTWSLFLKVKALLNPPCFVIVSGGIIDSQEIKKYLQSGASGCQLGTAFVSTKESSQNSFIHRNKHYQTIMTDLVSGRNARCLRTPFIESLISRQLSKTLYDLPPFQYSYSGYKTWKQEKGSEEIGFYLVGQNYNLAEHDLTTDQVMENLTRDL